MTEAEASGAIWIILFSGLAVLIVVVAVWLFGKLFRSQYSPFKFVNRMLDTETAARITTPLSPDAAERRLKESVMRIGIPFVMQKRLVGQVAPRNIRVRLHRPFMSNSFAPVFAGAIESEDGQSVLRGTFRFHKFARYFMKFWFGFLIIWSTIGVPAGLVQLFSGQIEGAMFVGMPFAMFGFGIAFVKFGALLGAKDHEQISRRLAEAIGGTVTPI